MPTNQPTNQPSSLEKNRLLHFSCAQALADLVIPLEYGISKEEKLDIGQGILTPLLRKIRMDFQRVIENDFDLDDCSRLDPRFVVWMYPSWCFMVSCRMNLNHLNESGQLNRANLIVQIFQLPIHARDPVSLPPRAHSPLLYERKPHSFPPQRHSIRRSMRRVGRPSVAQGHGVSIRRLWT